MEIWDGVGLMGLIAVRRCSRIVRTMGMELHAGSRVGKHVITNLFLRNQNAAVIGCSSIVYPIAAYPFNLRSNIRASIGTPPST